jgi:hypothetical protein
MLGDHSRLVLRKGVTWKYNITSGDFGELLYRKLCEFKRAETHDNLNFDFLLIVST